MPVSSGPGGSVAPIENSVVRQFEIRMNAAAIIATTPTPKKPIDESQRNFAALTLFSNNPTGPVIAPLAKAR